MAEHLIILIIAVIILGYGYISRALMRFNISGPMVFTGLGLLISPLLLNLSTMHINAEFVTIIVELALVLILFSDAALLDLKLLRQSWALPARLLVIGLPITIFFGTVVAQLIFPDEPAIYMLLLALLLTPTDAALGKAVVSDSVVPEKIRSTINVESGLNDGICVPILLVLVVIIVSGISGEGGGDWISYVFQQVIFGAVIGSLVGYVGAKLTQYSINHHWMQHSYQNLIPIALAILAFYVAEVLHGNGFIAAFFAGLYAGNTSQPMREHIEEFAESEGELFVLVSFFLFGLAFVPVTFQYINFNIVVYSLLSLTILRMLPIIICLIGAKLDGKRISFPSKLFIAWFGPRGIASILYVLIVAHEVGDIEGLETVYAVVTVTVLMSIVAHGLSAQPLSNLYRKQGGS